MIFTYQIPRAAASGAGGGGGSSGNNTTTGTVVYPYAVPASLFPAPANMSSPNSVVAAAAAPDPSSPSAFAVVNASAVSTSTHPNASVWFSVVGYGAGDAALIETNGSCGQNCGDLPLNWSTPSEVASFAAPVTGVRIGVVGTMYIVAVSSGGSTYLYNWSSLAGRWQPVGPVLSGQLGSLATDSMGFAVATFSGDAVNVATVSADGILEGQTTLSPSGLGANSVVSVGVTLAPTGSTYSTYVVFGVNGTDQVDFASSSDEVHFTAPRPIANFTGTPPVGVATPPGESPLSAERGIPGQVTLVSVGSQLTLLYTTYGSGQVSPALVSSGNGGTAWAGPYLAGAVNGSVLNPVLTVGPAGVVYGAWDLPDSGTGAVEEATFGPDGIPLTSPEMLATPTLGNSVPSGAPALAVDEFERPLVLWPIEPVNGSGAMAYTGGFLQANTSLATLGAFLNESLGESDFATPASSSSVVASFLANATQEISSINASLHMGRLCQAQNASAISLYQNLTHVPLAVSGGSGTVCAAHLDPSLRSSPLMNDSGIDVPNTDLAVYLDWVLEAEGVPVATSPLASVTDVAPYSGMALPTSLPPATSGSATVDSATETVTVTPTPYSPTAYELPVSNALPTWTKIIASVKCEMSGGGWGVYIADDYTTVNRTWTNVSVDGGTALTFTDSGSYPSVWIDNLSADQSYTWSASYRALTSETYMTSDSCTGQKTSQSVSPITLGPASIPTVSLSGSFTTSLFLTPGTPFLTATYNSNHSAAQLTVQFNSSLPATVQGSLSNSSGTQSWATSAAEINGAYTLPKSSRVGQAYTLSVSAASRAGTSKAPGSPSFSDGASGASPPEGATAACSFTLSSAVPTVSISNVTGAPYTSVNASTANVTWNASVDALGFFTYHEVGSPVNWTITGVAPVRAANGNWVYSLELHGLEPMVSYNGTFGVSWGQGCLVDEDQIVTQDFKTQSDPGFFTDATLSHVWAASVPYDPFDETGGGLKEVGWDNPTIPPLDANGSLTLVDGYVTVSNSTYRTPRIPFNSSEANPVPHSSNGTDGAYTVNLTNLTSAYRLQWGLNRPYEVTVVTNYTYPKETKKGLVTTGETAKGSTKGFVYEQESTDGGLSDSEIAAGWSYTENGTPGWGYPKLDRDSSNGLISDYVDMQYSLYPNTVDTSGSHMLDTWNLTFILGPEWSRNTTALLVNLSSSSYFDFYNETANYFLDSQVPRADQNLTNLVCTATGATCVHDHWTGDSSPAASAMLWSSKLLMTLSGKTWSPGPFLTLLKSEGVGWLRATTGTRYGYLIMTLWGKLSWGANPWETSTSADGLADGNQPDPLGPVILQLNLTYWGVNDSPGANAEAEPLINVSGGGQQLYSGWGPVEYYQACDDGAWNNCTLSWDTSDWYPNETVIVSVPIVSSTQYAHWHVEMMAATSSSGTLSPIANTSSWAVDLEDIGQKVNVSQAALYAWFPGYHYPEGHVSLNYTVLHPVPKANTLLLTPPNETTLATDALGHPEYVGEPDFDLLVLNLTNSTTALTLKNIPGASGGSSYSVTFAPGLNNILVPRGAFLYSPLGQAILNNTYLTANNSTSSLAFVPWDWNSATALPAGYNLSGPNIIRVFAPANESENDTSYFATHQQAFGGIPSNPGMEQGIESRQLQAVVWINITNTSGLGNHSGELSSLLAGLLLNSMGNVSYQLVNVTGDLTWLGLPATVLSDLASRNLLNSGNFGPPLYNAGGGSQYSGGGFFAEVWNALSGVGSFLVNIVSETLSWLGSTVAASQQYIDGAVAGAITAASVGLSKLASQTVTMLKAVAQTMAWALEQVVRWISQHVLTPIMNPIVGGATAYATQLASDVQTATNDAASGSVPGSVSDQFWKDLGGSVFVVALTLAAAVVIGLNLLATLCLGVGLVISLVLGFVLDAVMESVDHEVSPSVPSSSGYTRPTAAMVVAVAGVANSTSVNGTTPPDVSNATYGLTWSALAQIFSWSAGLFGLTLAWSSFCGAFIDPTGYVAATVGLAAAVTALILSLVSIAVHTIACTLAVLAVAALSLLVDFYSLSKPAGRTPGNQAVNVLTAALDAVSLTVDLVENHDKFHS